MSDFQNPKPGPQQISDGAEHRARGTRTGELAVSQMHGQYLEALRTGNIWTISSIAAGQAVTANNLVSVASANSLNGLYNKTATYALHILRAQVIVASNATAAGFCWGFNTPTQLGTVPTGVARAKRHSSGTTGGHQAVAFDGSLPVSGAAATDYFRPIVTCPTGTVNHVEDTGDIWVPPYGFYGIFADVVTATIVRTSITWEEVLL